MQKKILGFVLLLCFLVGMTSCQKKNKDNSSDNNSILVSSQRKDNITSDYMPDINSINSKAKAEDVNAEVKVSNLSDKKLGWGQGNQVDKQNRPTGCDTYMTKFNKYDAIFIGKPDTKKIYLTFDEGYENGYTNKILDILKEKKVSAVFFVTKDYVKAEDAIIKRIIAEGHILGNHTWNHPSMPTLTTEKVKKEINSLHDLVKEKYNYEMILFRPPMGEFSERTLSITQQLKYKSVFWSFAYEDWMTDSQPSNDVAIKKMVERLHSGAIYLLHAVSKTNTEVLGEFIDTARNKGYEVSKFDL